MTNTQNFAFWISDMTPFPNFWVLWWQNFPKFFHLFGELGRTLPQILPPNWMWSPSPPPPPRPTSLFGSTPWGKILTYELSGYRFKHQETNWIFLNTQNLKHLDLAEYFTKSGLWKYRLCQILWPLQNISQNFNNGNDIDFGNLEFARCFEIQVEKIIHILEIWISDILQS